MKTCDCYVCQSDLASIAPCAKETSNYKAMDEDHAIKLLTRLADSVF